MQENVFGFQISVDYVLVVEVFNCGADLSDVLLDGLFGHFSFFLEMMVQIMAEAGL